MLSRSGVIQKESLTERMPPRKLRRPAKLVDDTMIEIKKSALQIYAMTGDVPCESVCTNTIKTSY